MHPAAVAIAAAAAKGFAEGFGTQLARELFGGKSSDLKQIRKQLEAISKHLKLIEGKIDRLLIAVERLPGVIIGEFRQQLVDESYRALESYYQVLRNSSDTTISTPSVGDRAILLKAWFTIVDLECRPKLLMDLPFWTDFVRRYAVLDIDDTYVSHLRAKIRAIKGSLDLYEMTLSSIFDRAQISLMQGHFKDTKINAFHPYFEYRIADAPMVERWEREHCTVPRRYYIPDPDWGQKVARQKMLLETISIEITEEASRFNALYPAWVILTELIPFFDRGGSLAAYPDWASAEKSSDMFIEKPPRENCD